MLGGAGLVGRQIAVEIAKKLNPRKVVIASLRQEEVERTIADLKTRFPDAPIEWVGAWGDVFVRGDLAKTARSTATADPVQRDLLYEDLFGSLEPSYGASHLVALIREHAPDVIVDSINTATAISYQDVYSASVIARRDVHGYMQGEADREQANAAFDTLLLSQALPQLVRHIQILHRAMVEQGTRLYLKIGTTGTGGMGLNIPYTHSEDKPSVKLMTKTAVAFAHTGLLFLMARTPDGPIVKEIKPGGMIGYADVARRPIKDHGETVVLYASRRETLGGDLALREDEATYVSQGPLALPVVDTGENGVFTRGEFEAITALRQMEFITPEEIARDAVLEIRGSNTGFDVIAEIDSAIMNPTYRAGYLRQQVLVDMAAQEESGDLPSVALGQLGPPALSKLLWECHLLKLAYGTLAAVLATDAADISQRLHHLLADNPALAALITSIGVPVLLPDGQTALRGPRIRIPEVPGETHVTATPEAVDTWAGKGWVDLRSANMQHWLERFRTMQQTQQAIRGRGSAAVTRQAYLFEDIRIGEIVGWIFNNEADGYRMK